jgi:RimJ/RimL family protein N-acetyltransferase
MKLDAGLCLVRSWEEVDIPSLAAHANNRKIWRNLSDRFPYPYTLDDARAWVRLQQSAGEGSTNFAIVFEGRAVGGVGIARGELEHRRSAELGYWLGETYWGRGIATAAARTVADWAFELPDLARLEARVFAWNEASCRVLEKAGFQREACMRHWAFKDGQLVDTFLYARIRG